MSETFSFSPPRWGIASIVHEPLPLVQSFVAHHLDQGASEIQLFVDKGDPALLGAFEALPQVSVQDCTVPGFWDPHAERPKRLAICQRHVARVALGRAGTEWMLFCDVDEFVSDGGDLRADLAALDPRVEELRLPVWERFHTRPPRGIHVFEGSFRCRVGTDQDTADLYGEVAPYLNRGLTAHPVGKTLFRPDMRAEPGVHRGNPHPDAAPQGIRCASATRARLYHFDGMTALNWARKLRGRIIAPMKSGGGRHHSRLAQIEYAKTNDMDACISLYERLTRPDPPVRSEMERREMLDHRVFDPRAALATWFPEMQSWTLAPGAYDDALLGRPPTPSKPPSRLRRLFNRFR